MISFFEFRNFIFIILLIVMIIFDVCFAGFLSVGFITAIVVNSPERKLAKRTSVQCLKYLRRIDLVKGTYFIGIGYIRFLKEIKASKPCFNSTSKVMPKRVQEILSVRVEIS